METVHAAHRPAHKTLMAIVDDYAVRLPIRVQLQPRLMVGTTGQRKYVWWRGTHWTLEAETLDELRAFREALVAFFDLLDDIGTAAGVELLLRTVKRRTWKKAPIKRLVRKAVPEHLTPAKIKALKDQAPKLDVF